MTIKAIKIEPGEAAKKILLDTSLESLQKTVDGYIEITYPFDDNVCIVGNEEAKLVGKKGTIRINGSIYAGTLLLIGLNSEDDFADLTEEQLAKYLTQFSVPEDISAEEAAEDVGFAIFSW